MRSLVKTLALSIWLATLPFLSASAAVTDADVARERSKLQAFYSDPSNVGMDLDNLARIKAEIADGQYDRACTAQEHDPNKWHMLVDPTGTPAKTLLSRMHVAADRDPIIGFSLARAALAAGPGPPGRSDGWAPVLRAIASSPAHPLLLAVAVDIAKRGGRAEDVPPARARLMAVARTPAERALAGE